MVTLVSISLLVLVIVIVIISKNRINPNDRIAPYSGGGVYDQNRKLENTISFDKKVSSKPVKFSVHSTMKFNVSFPNDSKASFSNGSLEFEKGNFDEAIRNFDKVISANPNEAMTMFLMGMAYKSKGDKEKTKFWWNEALNKKEFLPDKMEGEIRKLLVLENNGQ